MVDLGITERKRSRRQKNPTKGKTRQQLTKEESKAFNLLDEALDALDGDVDRFIKVYCFLIEQRRRYL